MQDFLDQDAVPVVCRTTLLTRLAAAHRQHTKQASHTDTITVPRLSVTQLPPDCKHVIYLWLL